MSEEVSETTVFPINMAALLEQNGDLFCEAVDDAFTAFQGTGEATKAKLVVLAVNASNRGRSEPRELEFGGDLSDHINEMSAAAITGFITDGGEVDDEIGMLFLVTDGQEFGLSGTVYVDPEEFPPTTVMKSGEDTAA